MNKPSSKLLAGLLTNNERKPSSKLLAGLLTNDELKSKITNSSPTLSY